MMRYILNKVHSQILNDEKNIGLSLEKRKSSRNPETYMTDADYADDLTIKTEYMIIIVMLIAEV